jgi:hypothetical protein
MIDNIRDVWILTQSACCDEQERYQLGHPPLETEKYYPRKFKQNKQNFPSMGLVHMVAYLNKESQIVLIKKKICHCSLSHLFRSL